jgi:GNAT superfamily N-acetyltransferase
MALLIRPASVEDVAALTQTLEAYMFETFGRRWHGSAEALVADGFGAKVRLLVAEHASAGVVAFCAWQPCYDLHHCVAGSEIIDMYVMPGFRGLGVALLLVAEAAARTLESGGRFVKRQAVTKPGVRDLYERVAMSFPSTDCIVGGRAFRVLADLAGKPARVVLRNLPDKSWNHEA